MHSRQQTAGKLCTPRGSGTEYEKRAKRNESCVRCCPQMDADDRSVACQLWESETGGTAAGFPVTGDGKTSADYQQPVVSRVKNV